MKITEIHIRNFKSIREMHIRNIENALILVGQNNTGKTTVLDAIRAAGGEYSIQEEDFGEDNANIEITISLEFSEEDLEQMHMRGMVSRYRKRQAWQQDFNKKLPSFHNGIPTFTMIANKNGRTRCH